MPAVKTNAETSQLIKEDFTFTSRDIRENPGILRPFFEKRKHQRYAFVIHGYNTGHLRYDIHLKRKCFILCQLKNALFKPICSLLVLAYMEVIAAGAIFTIFDRTHENRKFEIWN